MTRFYLLMPDASRVSAQDIDNLDDSFTIVTVVDRRRNQVRARTSGASFTIPAGQVNWTIGLPDAAPDETGRIRQAEYAIEKYLLSSGVDCLQAYPNIVEIRIEREGRGTTGGPIMESIEQLASSFLERLQEMVSEEGEVEVALDAAAERARKANLHPATAHLLRQLSVVAEKFEPGTTFGLVPNTPEVDGFVAPLTTSGYLPSGDTSFGTVFPGTISGVATELPTIAAQMMSDALSRGRSMRTVAAEVLDMGTIKNPYSFARQAGAIAREENPELNPDDLEQAVQALGEALSQNRGPVPF